MKKNINSRRNFIKKSIVVPSIMILPRHVLGGKGYTSPSDKLNIAGIGVRKWGMGANNLSQCATENIVALCDVDQKQAAPTYKKYPKTDVNCCFCQVFEGEDGLGIVFGGCLEVGLERFGIGS